MANFKDVQYEPIRRLIDPKYLALVEKLEDCYYGDKIAVNGRRTRQNCWLDGTSRPFTMGGQTFDVQATPEESKALFEKLHGLIWKQYDIEFDIENQKLAPAPDTLSEDERLQAKNLGYYIENGEKKPVKIPDENYKIRTDEQGVQFNKIDKLKAEIQKEGIIVDVPKISAKKWQELQDD